MSIRKGFTAAERQWILRRDDATCLICEGKQAEMQVHHIVPFRFAVSVLHWSIDRANAITNGATLCVGCHLGKGTQDRNFAVHPDIGRAYKSYYRNGESFDEVFAHRDALCRKGKIYWNPTHDNELAKMALANTIAYVLREPSDPPPMR